MRRILLALAPSMLAAGTALADVTGMAGVPGGDVLSVNRQRIRLYGIDAVELHQYCYIDGKPWACGPVAIRTLEVMVSLQPVTCRETGDAPDALGIWATCTVGGRDIGEAMVRAGMALALRSQTNRYVEAEEAAKAQGAGIWKSRFLDPAAYRADLRAIEERLAARQRDAMRAVVERTLTEGDGAIQIFEKYRIVRGNAGTARREFAVDEIAPGFIEKSIPPDNAFDWRDPAEALVAWQQAVGQQAQSEARRSTLEGLFTRPTRVIDAPDAAAYWRAVQDQAAPLIEAGRQPVLLVRSTGDPPWISEWLGSEPPPGARITQRNDVKSDYYLGTLNGIDLHRAELPESQSMLFPADLLTEVRYGADAGGRVVAAGARPASEKDPAKVVFGYAQGLVWKADEVVVFTYPYKPPADEYER